jgi:hydroxyethylthiazole kinase-like sugar kinase family protein
MLKIWMDLAFDSALLCAEAQEVMGLRLMKLAGGGVHAEREARRMVAEKSVAFTDAAVSLATGASIDKVVRRYRKIVRANKTRLTRF